MRKLAVIALLLGSVGVSSVGNAQNLEERLKKFADDFAKGYTAPFTDAFGASLNSGWYHSADVTDGLDLFVGVKVIMMPIPSDAKKFRIASPYQPSTTDETPTIFGPSEDTQISGSTPTSDPRNYPQGFNVSLAPMFVPHISVGNVFGTRAILRYLPKVTLGDYGDFEFFGIGVQHSISRYIPLVPLEISALAAYQNLSLGSLVKANGFTIGAQASKSFVLITVYGGIAYESSTMKFAYDASPPISKRIEFEANGKNNFRVTAGLALSLGLIKLNVDYSVASQPVATAGIGVGW